MASFLLATLYSIATFHEGLTFARLYTRYLSIHKNLRILYCMQIFLAVRSTESSLSIYNGLFISYFDTTIYMFCSRMFSAYRYCTRPTLLSLVLYQVCSLSTRPFCCALATRFAPDILWWCARSSEPTGTVLSLHYSPSFFTESALSIYNGLATLFAPLLFSDQRDFNCILW
jgi:hypothetical protein